MYIDIYFLINFVMDWCTLECTLGRLGISKRRLGGGAFVGALGSCLWEMGVSIRMLYPMGAFLLSLLMLYVCIGRRPWRQWWNLLVQLYAYSFLFAGVIPYVSRYISLWILTVLLSFAGIQLWLYWQKRLKPQGLSVVIEEQERRWEGKAILDTGHVLKDPISRRPILIVDPAALPKEWGGSWPIVYQSVQGQGMMYGFWPQRVWIGGRLYKEKEILVAKAEVWNEKGFSAIIPGYLMEE